jgi:6-methylsalicylate decarboxylase
MPGIPTWSEDAHLDMMSTCNISKCILSITSPGVHLVANDDELAGKVARLCNDAGAELKRRRPDQFGFFASLPVPNIKEAIVELNRAYDELDCDGITLETNKHGVYLGDSRLDPLMAELNSRHGTLFIHPTTPCMLDGQTAAVPLTLFPRSTYEFFFDTCRTVINLFATGTVRRNPNITFIIPHMGGAFPPLIQRFSRVAPILGLPGIDPELSPDFVLDRLNNQFYFDTAGWPFGGQAQGLLQYVSPERILFGTDFPFTPLPAVINAVAGHDEHMRTTFGSDEAVDKVCRGNARRLLQDSGDIRKRLAKGTSKEASNAS